ncbi:M16 family metallopeptidase [Sunxiuqinia elliptica]|uniref:Zinc protease n=1 Tax=Sunxiuqinia elliptica TaxID=655355 RepID=A0A1I2ISB6_9BACT|nr:M16 family metallopeptidase [Sunxiuqinia elliptica]SFF44533.1 zinc protease [Sunxiuqinia elliptica]
MKYRFITYLLVASFTLFFTTKGFAQLTDQSVIPLNPKVVKKTLPNGFTYYLQHNAIPEKQVQFRMIIKAGSILETEEQRGFAHFLEHMVFNGSKHFPNNTLIDYLQSIGVEFGADINAYTGYDETVYMLPLPNSNEQTLNKAFHFFGDILSGLTLSTEAIDKERGIILEEWRTTIGLDNRLKDEMYPMLYHNARYLHRRPIGLMEVVTKEGNDEELRKFHRAWYRPNLTSLVVVGNFDQEDIEQRIEATFGTIKNPENAPERKHYTLPAHDNTLIKIIKDQEITNTSVKIIRKFPHQDEKTLADLKRSVTNIIYTYMVNQRLTDIAQQKDAPYMYAHSYATSGPGHTDRYMSLATVKADKIIEGTQGLMRELLRIKKFGFTQAELERKKEILYNDMERMAHEENKQSSGQIMDAISNHILYGEENASISFKKEFVQKTLDQITLDDIQALVDEYIDQSEENRVIFVTAPADTDTPTEEELLTALKDVAKEKLAPYDDLAIDEPLMAEKPQAGQILKETYSEEMGITTIEFDNGVSVALKPTTFKNDEIRFSSLREGGYSLASIDNFDNASMAAILVNGGGLSKFNALEVERILSGKQVYIAPYIHRYTEGVSGFSSKADFETLLQLSYLTYTAPRKDEAKFEQFIENKKEYNRNTLNSPDSYFADEVNKIMMQNSPRTATLLTPEQLDQISLDKAFDFYQSRFGSAYGTRFFIVGSFEVDSIKPLLAQYLGSLPSKEIRTTYADHGIRPPKGEHRYEFPRNTDEKTKVLMRFTGKYPSSQKSRIEMALLSDILTIRLNEKLREEIGGVYSPYAASTILQRPYDSYRMDIYFTCSPANVDTLIQATFGEIESMKKQVKAANLEKVQKAWLKNREGSLETNGYWRRVLEDQWTRGEKAKDFERYEKHIQGVTTKRLSKLAKKYLDQKNHLQFILSPEK